MATYKYRPRYEYNGPTHSQPLREELTKQEVRRRFSLFFDEIGSYFSDLGAQIEPAGDGTIAITTDVPEEECDSRVKRCLNNLDLYGDKITE